jgi:hypothetical protein
VSRQQRHLDRQRNYQRFVERRRGAIAAAATDMVAVFYFDQADTEKPCRLATRLEARQMRDVEHAGKFENNGRTFRLSINSPAPELRPFVCSATPDSYKTISLAEMKANVGETDNCDGEAAPRHLVQRAQEKIRAIGRRDAGTFDPKSPLAFGSWTAVRDRVAAATA